AGAEHHIHFAGGRRHRFEIDQRLAHRIVHRALPRTFRDKALIALAAAIAITTRLLPIAIADHDREVYANHRPDVAIGFAVGAQDFDRLPGSCDTGRHLPHARVFGARIGIDRL